MSSSNATQDVSAPPAEPDPAPKRGRISNELWIAIVTAVATIAVAAIGTFVAVDVGTVEVRMVGDGRNSGDLQAEVSRLNTENAELRSANESLRAQLDASGPDTADGASGPDTADGASDASGAASADPAGSPVVRRETPEPLDLSPNSCLDLDSEALNWDVGDRGDLCYEYFGDLAGADLTVVDEKPSRTDCESQTHLSENVGKPEDFTGKYVCASTDEDRLVRMEIIDAEYASFVTMHITVWEAQA